MVEINGKGDKQRPTDKEEFDKNYNRIFKNLSRFDDWYCRPIKDSSFL